MKSFFVTMFVGAGIIAGLMLIVLFFMKGAGMMGAAVSSLFLDHPLENSDATALGICLTLGPFMVYGLGKAGRSLFGDIRSL